MNINSLKKNLVEKKIRLDRVNICGEGTRADSLVIAKIKKQVLGNTKLGPRVKALVDIDIHWEVYFNERGQKYELERHFNEASACEDFYKRTIQASKQSPKYYTEPSDFGVSTD